MPEFIYLVCDQQGERRSGEMEASSREKVAQILMKKGFTIIRVDLIKPKHWIWAFMQPVRPQILALWIRQVAVMLAAGIPLRRAVYSLQPQQGPTRFKKAMRRLLDDLTNGYSFSQAMMRAPEFFSNFMVGSTRIGEASGRLAETLDLCATHFEKEYDYSMKLKTALIYPTVLLTSSGLLVAFIFTFMIPKFVGLFVDMKLELPWATRWLVNSAHFCETYGMVVLCTAAGPLIVLIWLFHYWSKTRRGKGSIERFLLALPWYGRQIRFRMLAAYFRSFGTLLGSGVTMYSSLNLLVRSVDRELLRRTAAKQVEAVRIGKNLNYAMSMERIFPRMAVEMVLVGEETGTIDAMMYRLAEFYDTEMTRGLDTIGKMVEPIVLMILGAGVAVVLLAAFLPIYQLASSF